MLPREWLRLLTVYVLREMRDAMASRQMQFEDENGVKPNSYSYGYPAYSYGYGYGYGREVHQRRAAGRGSPKASFQGSRSTPARSPLPASLMRPLPRGLTVYGIV